MAPVDSVSELDFESLPPTLRRKYFSTLERLRLAQIDAFHDPAVRNGRPLRKSASQRYPPSRQLRAPPLDRTSSVLRRHPSRRLQKHQSLKVHYFAAQIDSQWFSTLPPKIQRKQFSREEQILLAGIRDSVMLDAADEALYRLGRQLNTSSSTFVSALSSQNGDTLQANCGIETGLHTVLDINADVSDHKSFRWMDDEDECDLGLDEYHTAIIETVRPEAQLCKQRQSFRRNMSLSSNHFPGGSVSSQRNPLSNWSAPAPRPACSAHSEPTSAFLASKHRSQNSITKTDPVAKHYQDPEARLKLRVYLASPQKFDEAIEFGFPSTEFMEDVNHARMPKSPQRTEDSAQAFFMDKSATFLTDSANDTTSSVVSNGLFTPSESVFPSSYLSTEGSFETFAMARHYAAHRSSEPYAQASTADREMTLHMTLTRPDLRSVNEPRAMHAQEDDPLRLIDLSLPKESYPFWDDFPVEESRIKRFWRKLRHG